VAISPANSPFFLDLLLHQARLFCLDILVDIPFKMPIEAEEVVKF